MMNGAVWQHPHANNIANHNNHTHHDHHNARFTTKQEGKRNLGSSLCTTTPVTHNNTRARQR